MMSEIDQYALEDRNTMRNIRILIGCLLCISAGLIVAVAIIGS